MLKKKKFLNVDKRQDFFFFFTYRIGVDACIYLNNQNSLTQLICKKNIQLHCFC